MEKSEEKFQMSHRNFLKESAFAGAGAWVSGKQRPKLEILAESLHDGIIDNFQNFLDCVRTRKKPNASIEADVEAARTSWT